MGTMGRGESAEVRPGRVFLLYLIIWFAGAVTAHWLLRNQAPGVQSALLLPVWDALDCAVFLFVAAATPQLRRLTLGLRAKPVAKPSASDVLIAYGVMLGWGLGLSRLLFILPFVLANPDALWIGVPAYVDYATMFFAATSAGVMTPVVEELVFRGFLQNLWIARHGTWRGLLLASLAFGILHRTTAPFAFVAGIVLGLVYIKYRSLVLCMLLHGVYNLTKFTPLQLPFVDKPASDIGSFAGWVPEIAVTIALIPVAVLFWRRFKPNAVPAAHAPGSPGLP